MLVLDLFFSTLAPMDMPETSQTAIIFMPLLCRLLSSHLPCVQEIMDVEQIMEEDQSLPLTEENIELVLDEIRPYLVGESDLGRSRLFSNHLSRCREAVTAGN